MNEPTAAQRTIRLPDALDLLAQIRDHLARPANEEQDFVRFCVNNIGWSHGQHLQDLWVAFEGRMKRDGYFVEFGAIDGVSYSNSYALEKHLGWNGIVAEPNKTWHEAIHQNRGCAVDERCVWIRTGEMIRFNQTPITGLSTIDSYSASDHNAGHREAGERYDVETVSLTDLLDQWKAPRRIDYLSIDTEGSEYDILSAFDWSRYEIGIITVEHNHTPMREALADLLIPKGYVRKFESYSHADDWYILRG